MFDGVTATAMCFFIPPLELDQLDAPQVVRNILNTERGRCLFIIKNSLIHQARLVARS